MLEAYKDFWKRYVDFKGKSNRLQFWTPVLIHIIVVFVVALIGVISFITGAFIISAILSALVGIFGLAIIVPMIAVTLRRFYDAGRKRLSAIILIAFSVLINITFDIVQINSVAISLNIIELISTILLIYVTLLPSKSTSDEALKWL
ncbi:DUF805 domain-containing protein [Staphylococcus gallinarum]|jgi:uncharacterized membrane protein YhaH (DUF805 family)|uniref:DUF805 domain-containing protein n=2 Tax=Staphylococcus gallinarum TaxID=1293 RepID=A0ABQ0Y390_STAGA|nr:DUF805 domain-containing protein [Staphylococcus gallinarum]KIR11187.1 hypothetical protein SH09_08580 [Staphylococcus gallinarum]MCD8785139.1 DUF805 domain-containing protein [Staphylococcus gallinarum]MCD8821377.1 DUF805 domain-containing protein [Staphylococcus gallinarum]MCD8826896.1 DUF805 domain-containing protein [Staphylococcus gallinarum]MCD8844377.1 DUF805 domain-containing protein [Staphylococcus gallinarum]